MPVTPMRLRGRPAHESSASRRSLPGVCMTPTSSGAPSLSRMSRPVGPMRRSRGSPEGLGQASVPAASEGDMRSATDGVTDLQPRTGRRSHRGDGRSAD